MLLSNTDDDFFMFEEMCEDENKSVEDYRYKGKILFCQCADNLRLNDLCHLRNSIAYSKMNPETKNCILRNDNLRALPEHFKNAQVKWFRKDGVCYEVDTISEFKKLGGKIIIAR